jgi:hypothetical protein
MIAMMKQVIEYAGVPVGIVIPDKDFLKFIAVKFDVHDLDGQHFASPADVLRAIHVMMSESRRDISRVA